MEKIFLNILVWFVLGISIGLIGVFIVFPLLGQHSIFPGVFQPSQSGNQSFHTSNNATNSTNNSSISNPLRPIVYANYSLNVILLTSSECAQCNEKLDTFVSFISANTANNSYSIGSTSFFRVDPTSSQGAMLISQYHIQILPAIIFSVSDAHAAPNLASFSSLLFAEKVDNLTYLSQPTLIPYFNLTSGKAVGLVKGIAISATDCSACLDAGRYFSALEGAPLYIVFSSTSVLNESEAYSLIGKYNLTRLPALILSSDIMDYPEYADSLSSLGRIAPDGSFVLNDTAVPYVDLSHNHTVRGIIDVRVINTPSCLDCFNATYAAAQIASMMHMAIGNVSQYDYGSSSDAASLMRQYNITHIPTFIYSPEASFYPGFETQWIDQDHRIASDGWFVFESGGIPGIKVLNITAG